MIIDISSEHFEIEGIENKMRENDMGKKMLNLMTIVGLFVSIVTWDCDRLFFQSYDRIISFRYSLKSINAQVHYYKEFQNVHAL